MQTNHNQVRGDQTQTNPLRLNPYPLRHHLFSCSSICWGFQILCAMWSYCNIDTWPQLMLNPRSPFWNWYISNVATKLSANSNVFHLIVNVLAICQIFAANLYLQPGISYVYFRHVIIRDNVKEKQLHVFPTDLVQTWLLISLEHEVGIPPVRSHTIECICTNRILNLHMQVWIYEILKSGSSMLGSDISTFYGARHDGATRLRALFLRKTQPCTTLRRYRSLPPAYPSKRSPQRIYGCAAKTLESQQFTVGC